MSESSQRGKRLELEVAKLLRHKLGAVGRSGIHRDNRSGAGATTKTDIKDWYQETPFDIECKDHATIKVKEWFRQAEAAASYTRIATLVFRADEKILATVKFEDLVNLAVELRDAQAEILELKKPVVMHHIKNPSPKTVIALQQLGEAVVKRGHQPQVQMCRADHIADQWGYCQQLSCKFSRGYRPPKKKRGVE